MSKIIPGSNCKTLAHEIAKNTNLQYVESDKKTFPDGELRI